ncbi:lysophospholipid acyltransferase family protein [Tropicimonas sp. IMCC34043]|uniref:lysophospholipid acyltransferase family protein n=1 Tax=Tropicimonas sp. IMCC34043 TaxID=2248760 RepID=UPI001300A528|nr:DUF374 domain-containing protein [Tropicimonas sp. IMCC34043]
MQRRLEALADSPAVTGAAANLITWYLRRLHARTEWTIHGDDELIAEVRGGQPVIMALWHGRLALAPKGWDPAWGPICIVTSSARPGRMVGRVMQCFGMDTLPMRDRKSNTATSLQVARMAKEGKSMGFAIDGPEGPARIAKSVPVDWARLTGCPIWLFTFSVERYRLLGSWDKLALPRPGGRGVILYRRWQEVVPKRLDEDTREMLRGRLQADLDALTREADRMCGHAEQIN